MFDLVIYGCQVKDVKTQGETSFMEERIKCIECGEYHDESEVAFIESVDGYVCQACLDEHYTQCDDCCEYVRKDCMYYIDGTGEYVCESCFDNNYTRCNDCGEWHYNDDMYYIDCKDGYVCESCFENNYVRCDDCGNYVLREYSYVTADGNTICDDCYDDSYFTCEDCGNIYHWDDVCNIDDYYYCPDCAEDHNDGILGYHGFSDWTPRYIDNQNEGLLKGFELEIETGNSTYYNNEIACKLKDILGNLIVCENDSSLDDGFEIITHPMTPQFFAKSENVFKEALSYLKENGCASHNTHTCGLHVHVNREQLTLNTELSQEEVIDNIILIMETFKEELVKFSRRSYGQIKEWANFLTDFDGAELSFDYLKKQKGKHGRYVALNLTNRKTIEFRIFKGTLRYETLSATLKLVDNICLLAKGDIDGLTWKDILGDCPNLIEYSESRGIVSEKQIKMYEI